MTAAERLATTTRRRAILTLLFFAPGRTLNVPRLVTQLEEQHGQIASSGKVRADLVALADQSYITCVEDASTLTESGRDVVMDRIDLAV
jgi:Fe2+ or Zn2+ uptake regulation protein